MIPSLRNIFRAAERSPEAAVPPGERVYAVGDIHGCAQLFAALIEAVDADDAAREPARTTVVLLGDLVDRGPDSAGVIALARGWQQRRRVRIIAGNHEEMFLESLDDQDVLRHFLRFGGRETLLSYPIAPDDFDRASLDEVQALARAAVPVADLDFVRGFENFVAIGDYLFVHAGVNPRVPLDEQELGDLRWIRQPFLDHRDSFGPIVVHGHTVFERPEVRHNRIGIDTGAYASGRLTALGLEGTDRWFVEVHHQDGAIRAATRSAA